MIGLEQLDFADDVRMAVEGLGDAKALASGADDVQLAVVEVLDVLDVGDGADLERLGDASNLLAGTDKDDAEGPRLLYTEADHLLVAVLEDVEGQGHAGQEDGVEGEEGEFHHGHPE